MRLGQTAAARAGAEALVADFPLYPDGHYLLGNMLLRATDPAGRDHLEQFKRLADAKLHIDLATNSLLSDTIEPARTEFAAALEFVPEHPVALVGLAEASRRAGDAAAAVELLEQARTVGADPTAWYANYILALGALDRRDEAQVAWAEAARLGLQPEYEVLEYMYADVSACRE
jgi:tetratricopeptide (TPR) repeat protein